VLQQIAIVQPHHCLLGQYDGYREEVGTTQTIDTVTPTYACIRMALNGGRWKDTPICLEAGKALDERLCEARLHIRGGGSGAGGSNALIVRLQPNPAIYFSTKSKAPGFSRSVVRTQFGVRYNIGRHLPDAYAKLVLDALRGQRSSFVREDELLCAWRIFTPLLHQMDDAAIRKQQQPPLPPTFSYKKGSNGPNKRNEFLLAAGIGSLTTSTSRRLMVSSL
jgi:glucose-6-phosphate 1-dehydrogenase